MAINIKEVSIGDFCWFQRKGEAKFYTGEVKSIFKDEKAVSLLANHPLGGFYTISCENCWWEDPKAKKTRKQTGSKKNIRKSEKK